VPMERDDADADAVVRVCIRGGPGVSMLDEDAVGEGVWMLCVWGGPGVPVSMLKLDCLRVTVRVLNCVDVEWTVIVEVESAGAGAGMSLLNRVSHFFSA
jgi:hypothetical protein